MNLSFSEEDLKFQQEVKSFIKENYPADIKEKMDKGIPTTKEDIVTWQKILSKKGWFAVNWPEEHGGTGWSVTNILLTDLKHGLLWLKMQIGYFV